MRLSFLAAVLLGAGSSWAEWKLPSPPRFASQPFDGGVVSCRGDQMKVSGVPKDSKMKYMAQAYIKGGAEGVCEYIVTDPDQKVKNDLKKVKLGEVYNHGAPLNGRPFNYQMLWAKQAHCSEPLFQDKQICLDKFYKWTSECIGNINGTNSNLGGTFWDDSGCLLIHLGDNWVDPIWSKNTTTLSSRISTSRPVSISTLVSTSTPVSASTPSGLL